MENSSNLPQGSYRRFFSSIGFDENPFAHTNADEEVERLPDYFISPPYFSAVFGNPADPKSFVVFAPRGGGKSAQRIMIERSCAMNKVLAITYDRFDFPELDRAGEVKLYHHLYKIIRFALMGILITVNNERQLAEDLSKHDREIIVKLAAQYLAGVNEAILKTALDSLKSLKDKVKDFWNEWLPLIGPSIKLLLNKLLGVEISDLDKYGENPSKESTDLKYQLGLVIGIVRKLGFQSIYVLIDRVDEAELTGNDARASFSLLRPLLKDLELLELDGIGFKFFLWDQLEPLYTEIARTDRIRKETLEWDDEMLEAMWRKRLLAYSRGQISELLSVSEETKPRNPDQLALIFANHSPRDMIRIGAHIIAEQQEIDLRCEQITASAVYRGVEKFCSERSEEIASDRTLRELRKVHQVDFTIPDLANYVFREKQATTRSRIHRWRGEGAIVDVGRIDNPNPRRKRPVKLIALKDIRTAKEVYSELGITEFLETKYRQCPRCGATALRDWGDSDSLSTCHDCQFDLESKEDLDSIETWKRKQFASQQRRLYRHEQLSFEKMLKSDQDDELVPE
jgi:hypothetical protein